MIINPEIIKFYEKQENTYPLIDKAFFCEILYKYLKLTKTTDTNIIENEYYIRKILEDNKDTEYGIFLNSLRWPIKYIQDSLNLAKSMSLSWKIENKKKYKKEIDENKIIGHILFIPFNEI